MQFKSKTLKKSLLLLFFISQSFAQFSVTKHSINNGGGTSQGNGFKVSGTIGQTNASAPITGTNYSLNGGFWSNSVNTDIIFKNSFEN